MENFKMLTLFITMFITSYGFAQDQQSVYYQKAEKLYRDAAAKTNCPSTRGKVLLEYAEWNARMVKVLAGTLTTAGPQPTTPVPPCDGDRIGSGGSNSNATSPDNSNNTESVNALIGAANDIFSMIQADKKKKEDYWNSLTPKEQQATLQAKETADSVKWANRMANDQEEVEGFKNRRFAIGVYGALENRDFITDDLSEFHNVDYYGTPIPILSKVQNSTNYNLGINFEWVTNFFPLDNNTRRSLFNLGIYYVTYSAAMVIDQNLDKSIKFDGNVAMLKFQSIRIAPTLSFRLFRLGNNEDASGVFFQGGLKADYMFSAMAKPATIDKNFIVGYNSIQMKYNLNDHFNKLEWGVIVGLKLDLTRHFFINLQYDIFGGFNDKILKSNYAKDSDYYTFQNKHKTTFGMGIYF